MSIFCRTHIAVGHRIQGGSPGPLRLPSAAGGGGGGSGLGGRGGSGDGGCFVGVDSGNGGGGSGIGGKNVSFIVSLMLFQ